ncbi:MAG: DNA recombination/repair protein RecA [Chloroflexi bacterium]|nr:MAG: DNA recombination/repair protein RecA [Chloroflexota bacterium]
MNATATAVRPLPELLESLRAKGLRRGVGPMVGEAVATPSPSNRGAIPSGFSALDEALRTGGWPRGSLALLDAPRGTGATSLAIRSLAASQEAGGIVAWIDAAGCLDAAAAERLGIQLEWLLVVRPTSALEAIELAGWLARSGLVDALALDLGESPDPAGGERHPGLVVGLDRLGQLLVRGRSVALLLTGEWLRAAVARVAAVRLALEREAWLAVDRDLVGQRIRATVTRHRWALAGETASLDLWFGEGRRIDALLPPLAVPREAAPALLPVAAIAEAEPEEQPGLRVLSA